MQNNVGRSRRLLYILIIVSLVIVLFVSVILGLIVLVGSLVYFFYRGRSAKGSSSPSFNEMPEEPTVQRETIIERETVKIPCKYCKTLIDPV